MLGFKLVLSSSLLLLANGNPVFELFGEPDPPIGADAPFPREAVCDELRTSLKTLSETGALRCERLPENKAFPPEINQFCTYSGTFILRDCFTSEDTAKCIREFEKVIMVGSDFLSFHF